MCDELVIFEFLESDASQENNEAKIQRTRLRDLSDPFAIDEVLFIKRYRLSKQLVHNLCDELRPHVASGSTRASDLPLERKVLIALSFFATGSYQRPVGDISGHSVAQPTVSVVIKQITNLLNLPHLQAKYIKFPRSSEERNDNKLKFFNKFKMPGVLGCIDCTHVAIVRPVENEERYYCRKQYHSLNVQLDEPASSGDSGDESGSEPESPSEKLLQVHKQEWTCDTNERDVKQRESHNEPQASTSSTTQEADSSKPCPSLPKLLPKIEMPGGAMLYHSGVLAGLDGIGSNLGLGNLAMGYPHGFILGLANQGQEGASSSNQPQFITIPLSMAMAAAAGGPTSTVTNGCGASASSDDSSELQDLSTGRK